MKTIYTLLPALLFSIIGVAQLGGVVTDPTSYTFYAEQVSTGYRQLSTGLKSLEKAEETVRLGKESVEKLQTVKGYLRQATLAKGILKNFEKSFDVINLMPSQLNKIKNKHVASNLDSQALELLEEVEIMSEITTMALTDNILEMNDGQRTMMLLDLYKASQDFTKRLTSMQSKISKYQR